MPDPRVQKLARLLVEYSLELKPGQQVVLRTSPNAGELNLAFYQEAVRAGSHVFVIQQIPGQDEAFYRLASDDQLDFISPLTRTIYESFDAMLVVDARSNSRELSAIDPGRIARAGKARASLNKIYLERSAAGSLRWAITVYPTNSMAQDADMSLVDYTDFVYGAGMLNEDDPVAFWRQEGQRQQKLIDWLKGRSRVSLKGENVDIRLSIQGRSFEPSDGKYNFPDGEIYTSPVENSVNGWVRFKYPAIAQGQEVSDIELWFEEGRVVKERAAKNQDFLTTLLNLDAGARTLGEWGIGTNYGIQRFSKHMLFDEKMGGTIHFAVGAGFPECGSRNESGLHWDMLCDMADSEIHIDDQLFYKNGHPIID